MFSLGLRRTEGNGGRGCSFTVTHVYLSSPISAVFSASNAACRAQGRWETAWTANGTRQPKSSPGTPEMSSCSLVEASALIICSSGGISKIHPDALRMFAVPELKIESWGRQLLSGLGLVCDGPDRHRVSLRNFSSWSSAVSFGNSARKLSRRVHACVRPRRSERALEGG